MPSSEPFGNDTYTLVCTSFKYVNMCVRFNYVLMPFHRLSLSQNVQTLKTVDERFQVMTQSQTFCDETPTLADATSNTVN
jgi:hypothetical protein